MDRLTALIAIAHLKLRLEIIQRHPEILKELSMTPNVKGLGGALAKLKHDLEMQATAALSEMTALSQRATEAIGRAKQKIADTRAAVEEIETFVSEDDGTNGGPSLDGSSGSSVASAVVPPAVGNVVSGRTL